jgi:hypothetical protein
MRGQETILQRIRETTERMKEALSGGDKKAFAELQDVRDALFSRLNTTVQASGKEEMDLICQIIHLDEEIFRMLRDQAVRTAHEMIRISHAMAELQSRSSVHPGSSYIDVKR